VIAARLRRPSAAIFAAAATVVSVVLPPAHIHLAAHDANDHDHGHAASAVEHSHWGSHGPSRAALDDDDGRAIYVDHPAVTSQVDTAVARPPTAVVALLDVPASPAFTAVERPTSGNSPRDGPARGGAILRGPPLDL